MRTADQPLIDAVQWLINVGFAVSVLAPAVTASFWPWWRTKPSFWGWTIMSFDLAFGLVLLPSFVEIDFGFHFVILIWLQLVFISLSVLLVAWRTVMIYLTQRDAAGGDEAE